MTGRSASRKLGRDLTAGNTPRAPGRPLDLKRHPLLKPEPTSQTVRPYWKGYLKLALVSCPIALHAACSTAERIAFRQINQATGNWLRQQLIGYVGVGSFGLA
jgi:hypothetical protein